MGGRRQSEVLHRAMYHKTHGKWIQKKKKKAGVNHESSFDSTLLQPSCEV